MEEQIDISYLEENKDLFKKYLDSVSSKGVICIASHYSKVKHGDAVANQIADFLAKYGLKLRELKFLLVDKDLKDLHLYCEVCGKRIPKIESEAIVCSTTCRKSSPSISDAIKASLSEKKKAFNVLKAQYLTGIEKETKDFRLEDMKVKKNELIQYFSGLRDSVGGANIATHNKLLQKGDPTAVCVARFMYKYDLTLGDIDALLKNDFKKSLFCKTCGKRLKSLSHDYCSLSCMKKDPEIQAKYEKACMEKYGVKNAAAADEVQEKMKLTNRERRGVDYSFQAEEVKAKIRETWEKNYGETNPNRSKIVRQRIIDTNIEKYGAEYAWQSEEVKEKINEKVSLTRRKKKYPLLLKLLKTRYIEMLSTYEEYLHNDDLKFRCLNCGAEFSAPYSTYIQYRIVCEKCYKNIRSNGEGELFHFVRSLISEDGKIIRNNRTILDGMELDLYVPSRKIALEYNGLYWHSTNKRGTDPKYHVTKMNICNEQGIHLFQIFENEWFYKKEIVKSIIRMKLGLSDRTIYARNCDIKELSADEYRNFLEENHLQGYAQAAIKLGLFLEDELVACVGIGKSRFKKDETELIRFCTKLNTRVVGGLSRLVKNSGVNNLISYVDLRYFSGSGYEKAGFSLISKSSPGYFYAKKDQVLSRYQCQKHLLSELLGENFDPEATEVENMTLAGYYQIFDCGMLKYEWRK